MIKNREQVYLLFHPDDDRNLIFQQWLNRNEAINSQVVSTTNNIELQTQFAIVKKNWILSDFFTPKYDVYAFQC
ncbi:hypothetical protein [Nostoc sp. NMS7]|uniref:hypothetical protein n=1 Tax=Nostoc sp. NMS7 TaxID=2815391 RepID=UPI0025EBC1AA|nr:hypothetical protein [Nostoc sp. NMS7]